MAKKPKQSKPAQSERKDKAMKIVVLFPYNYNSPNFEKVFWGEPEKRKYGRGVMAILTALKINADHLLIGNAFVKIDDEEVAEAKLELDLLCERIEELKLIAAKDGVPLLSIGGLDYFLETKVITDDNPKHTNTADVAQFVRDFCIKHFEPGHINEIIVVTDEGNPRAADEILKVCGDWTYVDIEVLYSKVLYHNGKRFIIEGPLGEIIGEDVKKLIADNKTRAITATIGRVEPK